MGVARTDELRHKVSRMGKGYGFEEVDNFVSQFGHTAHNGRHGEEKERNLRHRARRWVMERTHS